MNKEKDIHKKLEAKRKRDAYKKSKIIRKAFLVPDCHIPYHDKDALEVAFKVAEANGINEEGNEIILQGDFGDFYSVNAHGKSPDMEQVLRNEIKQVKNKLDEIRKRFPKAKKVFIEGNHEYRLARYIEKNAPALFGTVDVQSILGLEDFEFIPYSPWQGYKVLGTSLYARHEPTSSSENAAKLTLNRLMVSTTFAHNHRKTQSHVISLDGKDYRSFSCGWLGNKHSKAMQYVKHPHQWTQGFGFVYTVGASNFDYEIVDIMDGKAFFQGKVFKS